jgi:hypothetical protein
VPRRHPSLFEPATLLLIAVLCVFGAIIGMQLLVSLGITANTSLIGALAAMALARVPLAIFARYRSIHVRTWPRVRSPRPRSARRTACSCRSAFPGCSAGPISCPADAGGRLLRDAARRLPALPDVRSRVFPATGARPPGVAAAEAIKGRRRGRPRAVLMGGYRLRHRVLPPPSSSSLAWIGFAGSTAVSGIPMSAFGVAFIGNIWALAMSASACCCAAIPASSSADRLRDPYPQGRPDGCLYPARLHDRRRTSSRYFRWRSTADTPRGQGGRATAGVSDVEGEERALALARSAIVIAVFIAVVGGLMATCRWAC